jgi:hypothetical protein
MVSGLWHQLVLLVLYDYITIMDILNWLLLMDS